MLKGCLASDLDVGQSVGSIMGDPWVEHGADQADPALWVLVKEAIQQVLQGVADVDVFWELQGLMLDGIVQAKDGVRLERNNTCSQQNSQSQLI